MEKNQSKTVIIAAVAVVVLAIVFIFLYSRKNAEVKELMSQNTNLTQTMEQKDSIANDLESTFNEIEENLRLIKEKRHQISVSQAEGNVDRKQALLADIDDLNNMLEESSEKVEELEQKLKQSGVNARAFERRIAGLNDQINNQNQEIIELKTIIQEKNYQMAELNTKIEEMDQNIIRQIDTITTKQQVIDERTAQLNTGHFIVGTKKELKEKGLLNAAGGFLGIGRTKKLDAAFADSLFTVLDIRETTTIPLYCKKATILTEHPKESYELEEEGDQVTNLQITDPDEFWKVSKYAMIEIK